MQDVNQFDVAHEYDCANEQIHKPIRDEVSGKYQETEIFHNQPLKSDYFEQTNLGQLQAKTTKRDKRDLESFDSERYIRVPSESVSKVKHVP